MTKDVIAMAREAGATPYTNRHYPDRTTYTFNVEQLEKFAALSAAKAVVADKSAPTQQFKEKGMYRWQNKA